MEPLAKLLIILGLVLIIVGLAFWGIAKLTTNGRLPGDISIKGKNFTFMLPIASCLIISVLLTLVWSLFNRK